MSNHDSSFPPFLRLTLSQLPLCHTDGTACGPLSGQWRGGVLAVIGPDGGGQSSLLRALSGKRPCPAGSVKLHTPDGVVMAPSDPAWGRHVFWCDPDSDALDGLSGHAYLAHHRPNHLGWRDAVLQAHLNALGLQEHLDKPLYALSMGMRRKLRLCAAFASGALLTLLDEPTAALDLRSVRHVQHVLDSSGGLTTRLLCIASSDPTMAAEGHQKLDLANH